MLIIFFVSIIHSSGEELKLQNKARLKIQNYYAKPAQYFKWKTTFFELEPLRLDVFSNFLFFNWRADYWNEEWKQHYNTCNLLSEERINEANNEIDIAIINVKFDLGIDYTWPGFTVKARYTALIIV